MLMQYQVIMMMYYLIFLVASVAMIPAAFVFSVLVKFKRVQTASNNRELCLILGNACLFLIIGLPMLTLALVTDFFFFLKNNYSTNLKQVVIEHVINPINMSTIKLFIQICQQFNAMKIRSMLSQDIVKIFINKYDLYHNMQTIIFGQDVTVAKKNAKQNGGVTTSWATLVQQNKDRVKNQ